MAEKRKLTILLQAGEGAGERSRNGDICITLQFVWKIFSEEDKGVHRLLAFDSGVVAGPKSADGVCQKGVGDGTDISRAKAVIGVIGAGAHPGQIRSRKVGELA